MTGFRISLSRLAITGAVTSTTPIIVLKEIADAHSISYDENKLNEVRYLADLINTINVKNVNTIKEPYDMRDYQLIARFVNKNYQWKRSPLIRAFNLLLEYTNLNKLSEVHIGFKYGNQTPETPDNLNACILYGICKANRIDTRFDTTIAEMASNIQLLFSLRNPEIRHSIRTSIHEAMMYGNCDGYQLINILSQIDPDRSTQIIGISNSRSDNGRRNIIENIDTHNEIRFTYEDLSRISLDIRRRNIRILPRTHIEAIVMAAIHYKIDISEVDNPLAEYQELNRTPYFPIDRKLARRLQISNKYPDSIENPHIDQVFNIDLPIDMYDEQDLIAMCTEEGYKTDEISREGSHTLLQIAYLSPTFLHGKQGNIINNETTMLESINGEDCLEYNDVVTYGVRGQGMRAYSYGELTDTFKHYKRFQRPDGNNELYEDVAIEKLYILCHKDQRGDESEESFRNRLILAGEIDRVKLYMRTNQAQVNEFIDKYDQCQIHDRKRIEEFFRRLLDSGMYMRGWTGEGPYPLFSQDTLSGRDEQPSIDLRVTQSIQHLEQMLEDLNSIDELGDLIKELPLIFYNVVSGELLPSTDEREGLTIYERINIVKGGEDGSIHSCIRMSSNRFCASAYYYLTLLGCTRPFEIENLSHIQ
jgi:hypothetical protein